MTSDEENAVAEVWLDFVWQHSYRNPSLLPIFAPETCKVQVNRGTVGEFGTPEFFWVNLRAEETQRIWIAGTEPAQDLILFTWSQSLVFNFICLDLFRDTRYTCLKLRGSQSVALSGVMS